jgi:bacterioferritin-associated ferredoxin
MYACICRRITDTQVRDAVKEGACSLREFNKTVGTPMQCGKCTVFIEEVILETLQVYQPKQLDI